MARTDIYLKVVVEHGRDEHPRAIAAEICRQIEKVYGVRTAELSSFVTEQGVEH
ncbi:MAG: hypothetical protein ACRD7E_27920 [Bryobacteraceae bacterium]